MKRLSLIILVSFYCCFISGQSDVKVMAAGNGCENRVVEAEALLTDGFYDQCIVLINDVLRTCIMDKQDKISALEILANAYVETSETEKADSIINLLLHTGPHYELDESSNPESYNRLVKKYKIHPRFSIGIRNTADWVNFNSIKVYSVRDDIVFTESYNEKREGILTGFGLMYYGWAEFEFHNGMSLNGDLIFKWTKFNRDFYKESLFDVTYSETDNYIEIPIYLKKYFPVSNNILPYITAGMGWLYMTKAVGNATIHFPDNDLTSGTGEIDVIDIRNRNSFEWLIGAGVGYKIKNLRLFLDARFYSALNSFTNPEKGLNNTMLVNNYFYVDNAVRMNQFELGASISYTLFNSVRKKNTR